MQPDEALVFRFYDSGRHRPRWSAHTAFDPPDTPAQAPARRSIEIRALAFMDA